MKKLSNYVVAVLCVGSLAFSAGAFMKVNATPAVTAAPAGQPVDLTYAARTFLSHLKDASDRPEHCFRHAKVQKTFDTIA